MSYVFTFFSIIFCILIHEFGHYLAAKSVGIPITTFSIGFGRELVGWNMFGTRFRIAPILLGGYVKPAEIDLRPYGVWRRFVFYVGGSLANMVLPVLPLAVVALCMGSVANAIKMFEFPWIIAYETLRIIFSGIQLSDLSSPVGIVAAAPTFFDSLVHGATFFILINASIGVTNLLPIPVFDGGRIFMLLFERIRGWEKIEYKLLVSSAILMICLSVYTVFQDIVKLMS